MTGPINIAHARQAAVAHCKSQIEHCQTLIDAFPNTPLGALPESEREEYCSEFENEIVIYTEMLKRLESEDDSLLLAVLNEARDIKEMTDNRLKAAHQTGNPHVH